MNTKPIKTYTSEDFKAWGEAGGRAGSGKSKRRGSKAYYRELSALGVAKRKENMKNKQACG